MHQESTLPGIADLRTYVVNLRRRPDRRTWMEQTLPDELDPIYTSDWHGPFDGHELDHRRITDGGFQLFPWQIQSDNPWWSRPLKLGEVGCSLAHLACWQHAMRHGEEPYVVILEDDAVVAPDFAKALLTRIGGLERSFDLIYLGRFPLEPDRAVVPGFVSPGYSHCTFGYLLTRPALSKLLALRLDQAVVPIDEFLPATYLEHPRTDLRMRFPRQLTALACDPPLVAQLPKDLAGSDTEDSAYVCWPAADAQ